MEFWKPRAQPLYFLLISARVNTQLIPSYTQSDYQTGTGG